MAVAFSPEMQIIRVRGSYINLPKELTEMQINTIQFFYFNEHVPKDIMILYSEKQHSTTFNHLLSRERKKNTLNFGKIYYISD